MLDRLFYLSDCFQDATKILKQDFFELLFVKCFIISRFEFNLKIKNYEKIITIIFMILSVPVIFKSLVFDRLFHR